MGMIDLGPATRRVGALVVDVRDDELGRPTPCPGMTVGDLIDHIGTLSAGFTAAAQKRSAGSGGPPRPPSADHLAIGWRAHVARELAKLAAAWREPSAWEGMTSAGGVDLPGSVAGVVALDELLVHGWDVAVATGRAYDVPAAEAEAAIGFASSFGAPRDGLLFGPIVPVPASASPLDRLLGVTGRNPGWRAPTVAR
jgi:uncharacterized protein (TIGR03086 family)